MRRAFGESKPRRPIRNIPRESAAMALGDWLLPGRGLLHHVLVAAEPPSLLCRRSRRERVRAREDAGGSEQAHHVVVARTATRADDASLADADFVMLSPRSEPVTRRSASSSRSWHAVTRGIAIADKRSRRNRVRRMLQAYCAPVQGRWSCCGASVHARRLLWRETSKSVKARAASGARAAHEGARPAPPDAAPRAERRLPSATKAGIEKP